MARALVPLAQGCEELEAVTIIDLLRRAGIEVVSTDSGPSRAMCQIFLHLFRRTHTLQPLLVNLNDLSSCSMGVYSLGIRPA